MKKKKKKEMEMILRATANEERSIQEIYQNMVRKESLWCLSKTIPSLSTVSSAKERQLQTAGAESTGLLLPGSQEEGFLPERRVSAFLTLAPSTCD